MPKVNDSEDNSSSNEGKNDTTKGFLANTMGLIKDKDELSGL